MNTRLDRRRTNIHELSVFLETMKKSTDADRVDRVPRVFPMHAGHVMFDVLRRSGVQYLLCDREADVAMAELAVFMDCPVITNDSDFFILRPHPSLGVTNYRFILLDSLGKHHKRRRGVCTSCQAQKGAAMCYSLPCQTFDPAGPTLCSIDPCLLPLLAVLSGNDYVSDLRLPTSVSELLSTANTSHAGRSFRFRRLDAIVQWLSVTPTDVKGRLTEFLGQYESHELLNLRKTLVTNLSDYLLRPEVKGRQLAMYLNLPTDTLAAFNSPSSMKPARSEVADVNGSVVQLLHDLLTGLPTDRPIGDNADAEEIELYFQWPPSLINLFQTGDLEPSLFNALYVQNGSVTNFVFEDLASDSMNLISLKFQKIVHGLLLELETNNKCRVKLCGVKEDNSVVIYQRHNHEVVADIVPLSSVSYICSPLQELFAMHLQLDLSQRPSFFASPELRAVGACIAFWLRYSRDQGDHIPMSVKNHPVALALSVCFIVTYVRLKDILSDWTHVDSAVTDVCEMYASCANASKSHFRRSTSSSVVDSGWNISVVHQLNEVQSVWLHMESLVKLSVTLRQHVTGETDPTAWVDSESSAPFLSFLPAWVVFPSGRLIHWLAVELGELPVTVRMTDAIPWWVRKLSGAGGVGGTSALSSLLDFLSATDSLLS